MAKLHQVVENTPYLVTIADCTPSWSLNKYQHIHILYYCWQYPCRVSYSLLKDLVTVAPEKNLTSDVLLEYQLQAHLDLEMVPRSGNSTNRTAGLSVGHLLILIISIIKSFIIQIVSMANL